MSGNDLPVFINEEDEIRGLAFPPSEDLTHFLETDQIAGDLACAGFA